MREQLIEINNREINNVNKLEKSVQEVSDLFTDISLLVSIQGENINNIETNIQSTLYNIDKTNEELTIIKKKKDKKRKCCCICVIISIVFFFILIIIYT